LISQFPRKKLPALKITRYKIGIFDQNLKTALHSGKVDDAMLEQTLRLTLGQLKDLDAFRITAGGKDIGSPGGHIDFDSPLQLAPPIISEEEVRTLADPAPHLYAVIDPGHGGSDPGAYNWEVPNSVLEKNVVLDIGTRVYNYVDGRSDATAYMTRYSDIY
jgi:N-acetylmuramoyl-L-alanine amidase